MKRVLASIASLAVVALAPSARAEGAIFGISIAIAREAGARVVDDAWMNVQIADANRLFEPLGVRVRWTMEKDLPEPHGELHSRADRDALAPMLERGVVNVFVVRQLEDVDDPGMYRMGVCWTGPGSTRYIALSRTARRSVLAHELGHLFGNPHSTVMNNLMSYARDGEGAVAFLDDKQSARIKSFAARFLAAGTLVDVGPPLRFF